MDQNNRVRRGFPLGALFMLLSACAVVSALLSPIVRAVAVGQVGWRETAAASAGGALAAMAIGAVIGLHHYRPFRGLAWGTLTGGLVGMIVGPIFLAPGDEFGALVTMSLGGSAMLLVTGSALGYALRSSRR